MALEGSHSNDFAHERGISMQEMARRYTEWAQNDKYDKDIAEIFNAPKVIADKATVLYPDEGQRSQINILDVAAGTGFATEALRFKGFTKIDALEPSEGMIEQAKKKGLYNKYFTNFLDENPLPIKAGTYDVALISGGMGEGHIPCIGLTELTRVVKPGGYVIIAMREQYLSIVPEYIDRLEPHMEKLSQEKKWTRIERSPIPVYSWNNPGLLFVFKVTNPSN